MTGIEKYKAMLDGAYAMSKFIMDDYDKLKAMGVDIMQGAEFLKKVMAHCQQEMRKLKSGK